MRILILVILLSSGSVVSAQDFQSWNEVDLTASWRRADFVAPLLVRIDSSLPNPQFAAAGLTADMPLRWHLRFTAGYLFADLPQKSIQAHVPLVAITPSVRLRRMTLADRNRFEKLFDYGSQPVRYRNRSLFDEALGRRDLWHVFASDEVIWDLTNAAWSQNRLQAGAGLRLSERMLLEMYYLRRNAAAGAVPVNVLGTTLGIALSPRQRHRPQATRAMP